MHPLANAGVSGAVVSLALAYLGRHNITLLPEAVASLVTLTYTAAHAAGALTNALMARYAPGVETVVQAVEPALAPVVVKAVEQAVVYPSVKAAQAAQPVAG